MAPVTRQTKKKTTTRKIAANPVIKNEKPEPGLKELEIKTEIESKNMELGNNSLINENSTLNLEENRMSHDFSFLEVTLNLNDDEIITKNEVNNIHQCNLCRYFCKDEADLKRHVKYHLKDKLLKCHICPFVCKSNSELEKHFMSHIVKKRYACPNCEYSTPRCDKLNRHLLIHSGEKPYKCALCPYSGRDKDKLKRHNMIHTGEKPAKCPLCSYCGRDNDKVKRHLATHVRRIKE